MIAPQLRLPAAIATLGFLFLGLFLLWPLVNVFGASVLDTEGRAFTADNYARMLGRPFYRAAIGNTLGIAGMTIAVLTTLAASPRPPSSWWHVTSTSCPVRNASKACGPESIAEAWQYAEDLIMTLKESDRMTAMTALMVMLNTVAKELTKEA